MFKFFASIIAPLKPVLEKSYFGNTILEYFISISIIIFLLLLLFIFHHIVLKKMKKAAMKTETPLDDFVIILIEKNIFPLFFFGIFYLSTRNLELSQAFNKIINAMGIVLLSIFAIRFLSNSLRYWLINYVFTKDEDKQKISTLKGVFPAFNVFIWTCGIVFLIDNLGFSISAVVAGLGIGGIAIALASQSVLGDLFSYFCILLDHPFTLGDFITVGEFTGTVENIGLKTTRIRSISGELLIFPNTDLIRSRIKNFKQMSERRVVFKLNIAYNTPQKKLKEIPSVIEKIIRSKERIHFDRVHFASFGEFSLIFETAYVVTDSSYNLFMDIQQEINLEIKEAFAKRKIEFAYLTLQKTK